MSNVELQRRSINRAGLVFLIFLALTLFAFYMAKYGDPSRGLTNGLYAVVTFPITVASGAVTLLRLIKFLKLKK